MIKSARKPSSDPVQEKLRQTKAQWNKEVSQFVNDLIHFKKLLNGWPNKFYDEKSMIKDPIPADPGTIIGSLTNDFNEIVQKGNGVIREQLDYSKNRRKRQMKQLNLPLGQTPAEQEKPSTDLSKQLSIPLVAHFEQKYGLVSESSSRISRFFTRIVNPSAGFGASADLRRTRMSMLNAAAETYKKLGKFQVEVVKKSEESIQVSNQKLTEAWSKWTLVYREYAEYINKMGLNPNSHFAKEVKNQNENEEAVIENGKSVENGDEKNQDVIKITPPVVQTPAKKVVPVKEKPIGNVLPDMDKTAAANLEKLSQDFLKKWFGKTVHQLSPFDKTSSYRIKCHDIARDMRKQINLVMNSLEKGFNAEELDSLIKGANSQMITLRGMMRSLHLSALRDKKSLT